MKEFDLGIMPVVALAGITNVITFEGEVPGKSALNGSNPAIIMHATLLKMYYGKE